MSGIILQPKDYIESRYYGRVLSSSDIYEIQQLQVHLNTIVDVTNHKNSNKDEDTINYIANSLDEGINTLFKIRSKLTGV